MQEFRLNPISKKAQPPSFVRLELFIVYKDFEERLASKQEIMEVVKYLLQNTSSMPRVDTLQETCHLATAETVGKGHKSRWYRS